MEMTTIIVDGLEHSVPAGNVPSLVKKLVSEREEARTALSAKETAHGAAVTKMVQDHAKELTDLRGTMVPKTEIGKLVTERVSLLSDCASLCPELKVKDLDTAAVRRAMVTDLCTRLPSVKMVADAVLAGTLLDKAPDEQITVVCNAAIASCKTTVHDEAERRDKIAHAMAFSGEKPKGKEANAHDSGDEVEDLSDETFRRNHFQGQKPSGK